MFTTIKLWIGIGLIVGITSIVGGGYWYISDLNESLTTAKQQVIAYKTAVEQQNEFVKAKLNEISQISEINQKITSNNIKLQNDIDTLNKKFKVNAKGQSRDFGEIARAKPELVQKLINRASNNVNRCFEIASGAKLKEGERNNECEELISNIR